MNKYILALSLLMLTGGASAMETKNSITPSNCIVWCIDEAGIYTFPEKVDPASVFYTEEVLRASNVFRTENVLRVKRHVIWWEIKLKEGLYISQINPSNNYAITVSKRVLVQPLSGNQ